jgi:hypothetical protein
MAQSDAPIPPQEEFIPHSEALNLIRGAGLSDSTFYRWASTGRIAKRLASGRQRGAEYARADILQLISKKVVRGARETKGLLSATDWIRLTDFPFVQSLVLELYGPEQTVDMTITWRWWEKNPHMCRILYNAKDRRDVWGALTIIPLRQEIIYLLLRREISEREIVPEDIFTYEPGHSYSGYVASIAIHQQYKAYLRSLIWSILDFWCSLYPSVRMDRLFAFALNDTCLHMIRHLFFAPRYDVGMNAFELDLMRSGNPSRLVTLFQDCIRQKEKATTEY